MVTNQYFLLPRNDRYCFATFSICHHHKKVCPAVTLIIIPDKYTELIIEYLSVAFVFHRILFQTNMFVSLHSEGGFLDRSRQTQEAKDPFMPAIPPKMIGYMDEENSVTDHSYELPSYINDHVVSSILS